MLCTAIFHHSDEDVDLLCLNIITSMEKAKFMFPVEYTLMVYSLNEKRHGLWKIVFPGGNDHGKR